MKFLDNLQAQFEENPKQMIILSVIVLVILFIVFDKVKKIIDKDKAKKARDGVNEETDFVDPDKVNTEDGTTEPSITPAQAAVIANNQFLAMNRFGTLEDRLFDGLKGLTGIDLVLVFNAFGSKPYDTVNGIEGRPSWLWKDKNLFGWYYEELDEDELKEMRGIWQPSGLKL